MVLQTVLALAPADERLHPIADSGQEGAIGRVLGGGVAPRGVARCRSPLPGPGSYARWTRRSG